jgi:flavodoxin
MKSLVVFYTRSGTTKKVGEAISRVLECNIEEIVDTANRKGLFGWLRSGRDATRKRLTTILPTKLNPADYDIVIMGTPNWGALPAPAIRTYIEQNKSKFKKIAFFATSGGSNNEGTFKELALICGKSPHNVLGLRQKEVKRGDITEKINQFIAKLS